MKKIVLISGASSGIGKSTANLLLREGDVVYGAARRVERMNDLRDAGAHILAMDVTDEAAVGAGVHQILKAHGRIDVLVNNAGYGTYGAIEDVSLAEGKRQFDVNLFGLARLTQLVLPHMRQNRSGRIVNVSSMGGKIYMPLGGWYHAAKHAVEGFSDCLRLETGPFGIDVIVVEPGSTDTEWNQIAIASMKKASGRSAYADFTRRTVRMFESSHRLRSSPETIAKVIVKAIYAKRPKTRYAVGRFAKPLLLLRKLLPDRTFDRLLLSQMKP